MSVCCCSLAGTKACKTCRNNNDYGNFDKESIPNPLRVIEKETTFKINKTTLEKLEDFFQEIQMLPETEIDRILNVARKEVNVDNWKQSNPKYTIKWE